MVSSDKRTKRVVLASLLPAVLLACVLLVQWRSTACTFNEAEPGSGLYVCKQRLMGWQLQHSLIRVQRSTGVWPWRATVSGRSAAGAAGSVTLGGA